MGLASSKYDVILNGQGYLLVEESYREKAQQPFNPRFSTGDNGLGDLSYWQFLAQTAWASEGQEKFSDTTRYRQSVGWDLRDGKPRAMRPMSAITLDAAVPTVDADASYVAFDDFEAGIDVAKWNGPYNASYSYVVSNGGTNWYMGYYPHGSAVFLESGSHSGTLSMIGAAALSKSAVGTWLVTVKTRETGTGEAHGAFMFYASSDWNSGYVLRFEDTDITKWRLYKITGALGRNNYRAAQLSLLATFTATAAASTTTVCKITRTVAGLFEVFQDGVSLGTHTDTTYTGDLNGIMLTGYEKSSTEGFLFDNLSLPGAGANNFGLAGKVINYYNSLYTCYNSTGSDFAFTTIRTAAQASGMPKIVHQCADDIAVWNRDLSPTGDANTYLASVRGQTLRAYNGETQVFTLALTVHATLVVPISKTVIVVAGGIGGPNSGVQGLQVITMDAEAWTVASNYVLQLDGLTSGFVANYACLDSAGALYFASCDIGAYSYSIPSRVFYITSSDLLAAKPTVTATYTLSDFVVRGLFNLAGTVYYFGARRRGSYTKAELCSFPGTVIWTSSREDRLADTGDEEISFNQGIPCIWKNTNGVLFLGHTDLSTSLQPILQLDLSGTVREVGTLTDLQYDYAAFNPLCIAEWGSRFYAILPKDGAIHRSTSYYRTASSTTYLECSTFGSNTEMIEKTLYSVTVELSEALDSGKVLSVYVNSTLVGTIATADGTRKEIVLSTEMTGATFDVELRLQSGSEWQGYISGGPTLRYIPTQFKKRSWGFMVRATKALRLIDGTRETATPSALFSAIITAWESNIPITFVDIDGVSHTVIVTDFDRRVPLPDRAGGTEIEQLCAVELLEV